MTIALHVEQQNIYVKTFLDMTENDRPIYFQENIVHGLIALPEHIMIDNPQLVSAFEQKREKYIKDRSSAQGKDGCRIKISKEIQQEALKSEAQTLSYPFLFGEPSQTTPATPRETLPLRPASR